MKRRPRRNSDNLTISEVCERYRVKNSTLRGWIKDGVLGFSTNQLPEERVKGKMTQVLNPEQVERLKQFLKYRSLLLASGTDEYLDTAQVILYEIDQGNYEGVIEILKEMEQHLQDHLESLQAEIQSLHAKMHGDAEIDPDDTD
jgi:DNA-binding transcriptional MerR regulator